MEISSLKFLTYGMVINNIESIKGTKSKTEYNYINLSTLVDNFKLDFDYEPPEYIPYGNRPGFISKSYYQSNPETGYNFPPLAIDRYFRCTFCRQTGPGFHLVECKRPFDSSLTLTEEGTKFYPGRERGTSYLLIVKKRGQKKVVTKNIKSEKFTDNLKLIYENADSSKCTIRIARNGSVNIVSANVDSIETLPKQLVKKINESESLTSNFPGTKYTIDAGSSYVYTMLGQFDLLKSKETSSIDLSVLNGMLWESVTFKKKYLGNVVLMLDTPSNNLIVTQHVFNSGDIESRSGKPTNPYILFKFDLGDVKVNVMIFNRGSVQIRASIKNEPVDLSKSIKRVYTFFKDLLSRVDTSDLINSVTSKKMKGINNVIGGGAPRMCHDRPGSGYLLRPVPFSFYGKCPMPGYYVAPRGVKRDDNGLYEPCCVKLTQKGQDSKSRYSNILVDGYPDLVSQNYNETIPNPDNLAAVYKPGTKEQESRRFNGLRNLSEYQLIDCIQKSGYILPKNIFSEYHSLRGEVLTQFSKNFVKTEYPTVLTHQNFYLFSKKSYVVTPIPESSIPVYLFINPEGRSFFINSNKDVSESGLPDIPILYSTVILGNLIPFKKDFTFYPNDVTIFNGVTIISKNYIGSDSRFSSLMYVINTLRANEGTLNIESTFDQDVINGAKYYLAEYRVSGLLFIPENGPKLLWNDTTDINNLIISLAVKKIKGNRWAVTVEDKSIPESLLPQIDSGVVIPVKFTDENKIKNNDIILFGVIISRTDRKINTKQPLEPIEKLSEQINNYTEVLGILQSITDPITRQTFLTPNGFLLENKFYSHSDPDITKPLTVATV